MQQHDVAAAREDASRKNRCFIFGEHARTPLIKDLFSFDQKVDRTAGARNVVLLPLFID